MDPLSATNVDVSTLGFPLYLLRDIEAMNGWAGGHFLGKRGYRRVLGEFQTRSDTRSVPQSRLKMLQTSGSACDLLRSLKSPNYWTLSGRNSLWPAVSPIKGDFSRERCCLFLM